jgi:hypothetical protein
MKMGHGMKAFSRTLIACMSGCIDMRKAHFHIKSAMRKPIPHSSDDMIASVRIFVGSSLFLVANLRLLCFSVVSSSLCAYSVNSVPLWLKRR